MHVHHFRVRAAQNLSGFSQFIVGFLLILLSSATTTATTTPSTIILGDDRCANPFDLLVLFFDFLGIGLWVRIQPGLTILQRIQNLFLLIGIHLLTQTFVVAGALSRRTHRVNVAVKRVFRIHAFFHFLVLICELLRLLDHFLDLLLPM